MYEQSRKRLLQSDGPGTDLWLHDTDIHMLLHPIIGKTILSYHIY